jgi:hypothetical protein
MEHPQLVNTNPGMGGGQSAMVLHPQNCCGGPPIPLKVLHTPVQHSAPVVHVIPYVLHALHVFAVPLRLDAATQPGLPHVLPVGQHVTAPPFTHCV